MERMGQVQVLVAVLLHTLVWVDDAFAGLQWDPRGDRRLCIFRIYPNSTSTNLPMISTRLFYQVPEIPHICSYPLEHLHHRGERSPGYI